MRNLQAALGSSSITDLTLVFHPCFRLAWEDIATLLAVPEMLTHLSIHWLDSVHYDLFIHGPHLSNEDLWKAIQQHAASLESLDVYR